MAVVRQMQVVPADASITPLRRPSRVLSVDLIYHRVLNHAWSGRLLWLGMVVLHGVCVAFYFAVAYVYARIPSTLVAVNLKTFDLTIDMKYFPVAVAFHGLCGFVHVCLLAAMVSSSVLRRRLVFNREPYAHSGKFRWLILIEQWWDSIFGPLGVFGVDNVNFEVIFSLRELLETTLQSIQAYQMSRYVPRVWLNNLWVAIIAINCWTTPMLHHMPRLGHRTRLMLALLCDVLLDFISSVGSTSVLAVLYVQAYGFHTGDFNDAAWYSDLWFVNMVIEFQLVFIQSWYDFFTRAVFASSLLMSLDDIKILVSTLTPSDRARSSIAKRALISSPTSSATTRSSTVKIVHVIMSVWGLVILVLHFIATHDDVMPGCQLQVRPWASEASPAASCSSIARPCHRPAKETRAKSRPCGTNSVALITIQNCPALEIPASIQHLHRLLGTNINLCGLKSWNEDAAFTATTHPAMRHIALMAMDFSGFGNGNGSVLPAGISSPNTPPHLIDIFVLGCNWSDLPPNLDQIWPHQQNVMLPANSFSLVPDVVTRMRPIRLMLDENPLVELPAEIFEIVTFESVEVQSTLLVALPELPGGLPSGSKLQHLNIQNTNILELPAWMATTAFFRQARVRAEGTPLCTKIAHGSADTVAISGRIDCGNGITRS